ncbi:Chromosome segregation during meiosis [Cricetulus griseus]|nr:Chromosome segregation during meiosis [Cricetulus griseus]
MSLHFTYCGKHISVYQCSHLCCLVASHPDSLLIPFPSFMRTAELCLGMEICFRLFPCQRCLSYALDEYFEYDAEEFLVSLALLITEGRTPECSVKGRAESFHCPPAQSRFPGTARHECSDKLAQCRQARRTRSEVTLLWKNNLPIMVEVMLLPDCCYSDEGPSTEGTDLNDPAIKQDALLLERWILEPVPRQNGDRFIEEKALLLAVRSFVFFSQLSAWLSVSHGAIPRNILYRISAADVDLQWTFSQTPTEHVFPVPNVSHNVALKVSVQSLPRQAHYPVLTCSIHTNILYEKRIQEQELKAYQHRGPGEIEHRCPSSSQSLCNKHTWTMAPVSALHVRSGMTPEFTAAIRNVRLCPGTGSKSDHGASQASVLGFSGTMGEVRSQEASVRTLKSLSVIDSSVSSCQSSRQAVGEPNPLMDSLIQDRQEVIARIAQHLIHCDPSSSRMSEHPFSTQESTSLGSKLHRVPQEIEGVRRCKEAFSVSFGSPEIRSSDDTSEGKGRGKSETTQGETCTSHSPYPRQPVGETNPLIGSLLQERQDVIARIAQHLEHIDPTAHIPRPAFSKHDSNSIPSKVFRSSYDDKTLLKVNRDNASLSAAHTEVSLLGDRGDGKSPQPSKCFRSFKYSPQEKSLKHEVRTQHQEHPDDIIHSTGQDAHKAAGLLTSSNMTLCNESNLDLISRLESTPCKSQHKEQEMSREIEKQCSHCNSIDKQFCTNKCTEKIKDENYNPGSPSQLQCDDSKGIDSKLKVTVSEMSDCFNKYKTNCSIKDSKRSKTCEQSSQLSTENDLSEDTEGFRCTASNQLKTEQEEKEDSAAGKPQRKSVKHCLSTSERLKSADVLESVLNYRLDPLGIVDGFTAEVGASGTFCPTHLTLPVEVSFYSVSDDNAPSPYMASTFLITLFNPNKTVVKMFVVMYDLRGMPANHQTFLRQRTFSVPVKQEMKRSINKENVQHTAQLLRYLIHLRFQSSKSGKIYLHRDVRLLFSRKSMEVDSGAAYELKSYTESPTNPQFSPRC